MTSELGRRAFLQSTAGVAAVTAAAANRVTSAHNQQGAQTIPDRVLGRTDARLPMLGYGGAALPRLWGNPLSTEQRVELVRYVYNQGIRYYDTAGNYMESQSILGEGLKDVRDDVYLVSKVETTEPDKVRAAVEKSLQELQTDYLDCIQIHGTPGLEQMSVARAMEVHAELARLRDENVVRAIGFSAHSYFDKALALISSGGFDLCMLSYGYIPRGYNQVYSARMIELRNACIAKAHALGMGIAAMKIIGAGMLGAWSEYIVLGFDRQRLARLPGAAIRYVLDDERIDLLVIGMRLQTEVDANIGIISGDTAYTSEDRELLSEFSSRAFDSVAIKNMQIE